MDGWGFYSSINIWVADLQELDKDNSGALSYMEICSQLKLIDLDPPIHLTQSDFDVITQVCEPLNYFICRVGSNKFHPHTILCCGNIVSSNT